jgi:hypothetical protein
VDVKNQFPTGLITANIYRGGKRLAIQTNIFPGQMAIFIFKPTIYIGIESQVKEGEVMDPENIRQSNHAGPSNVCLLCATIRRP